jgi:hypothetical protein
MKWNMVLSALAVSVSLCGQSFGFGLLDRMLGLNDCGCNTCCSTAAPACGCDKGCGPSNCETTCSAAATPAAEPGCAAATAPSCGAPACEPACSAAGPSCGCAAPAEPSCGAAPACGTACGNCNPCCRPGLFQGLKGLFDCAFPCRPVIVFEPICHRSCCNSGCAAAAPSCGCAATAPSCGCAAAAPACGGCQKPCLLDCFRIKHKCCARTCGHHHCSLLGGSGCGGAAPSCGCVGSAPSCGGGDVGVPAASVPADAVPPIPPAPTADPSASYQKSRIISTDS